MRKKHALIITAYQEIGYLIDLLEIYSKYFCCYIHIDKKCKIFHEDMKALLKINNVYVISNYKINWGSYKHILAIINLLQKAVDDNMDYFHIISANTILIKNPKKLYDFFEENPKNIYMEVKSRKPELFNEFEYRYSAYFFEHMYNLRGRYHWFWERFEKYGSKLQRKIRLRKGIEFNYKGYIYCHLTSSAVLHVLKYVEENRNYIQILKYCYVSEEFFFQNILMKSPLNEFVVNNTLIYDDWEERGDGVPCFLNETDLGKLEDSTAFFARKVSQSQRVVFDMIRKKEDF